MFTKNLYLNVKHLIKINNWDNKESYFCLFKSIEGLSGSGADSPNNFISPSFQVGSCLELVVNKLNRVQGKLNELQSSDICTWATLVEIVWLVKKDFNLKWKNKIYIYFLNHLPLVYLVWP